MVRFSVRTGLALMVFGTAAWGQVVPDGSTATTVNLNSDGSVTVGIAPASNDGVSLNNYDQFNVGKPGVNLDNRVEGARTIVNEVTGTSQSEINGPVEVLGQTAHVIIANPNGISVDGGSFINTGRTVLTTGDISLNAREIAPGIYQENVVATTNGGTIQIRGGGLSGQMDAIDLIAHKVRVDGAVTNTGANAQASVNIVGGSSRTEFDSSVVPGNLDQTWESVTSTGATSEGAVLVEITRQGAIRSNRIEIQITDQGAGARLAGTGQATSREFILRADGQIEIANAQITAATDVSISGGGVRIDDSQIRADNGALAVVADETGRGGITGMNLSLSGDEMILSSAADIAFSADTLGGTEILTDMGNLVVAAQGRVSDLNGHWESAESLLMRASEGVTLSYSTIDGLRSVLVDTDGQLSATASQIKATDHVLLSADDAELSGTDRRTEVVATNGSLVVTTRGQSSAGDLVNDGALLQGGQLIDGVADAAGTGAEGAVTLNVAGDLRNRTQGDNLAVLFGAGGDVVVRAAGEVENNAGRLVANGDIRIVAAGDVLNLIDLPDGTNDPAVVETTTKGKRQWWTLWVKKKKRTFISVDYGTVENPENLAFMTATGSVSVTSGGTLLNQGGEINANGGDVDLTAVVVETVGVGSGRAYVERVCVVTCEYEGEGNVEILGGRINAQNDVNISASERVRNQGGLIVALNDVNITTPEAEFEAVLVPTVVNRPGGLYNFWASDAAWMYLRDRFGGIIADAGNIVFDTDKPVQVIGATLTAGGEVIADEGVEIVREPRVISPVMRHKIGLLRNVPPVSFE